MPRVSFRKLSKEGWGNWRNLDFRGGGGGVEVCLLECVCVCVYRILSLGGGELQSLVLTWRGCIAHNN